MLYKRTNLAQIEDSPFHIFSGQRKHVGYLRRVSKNAGFSIIAENARHSTPAQAYKHILAPEVEGASD